MAEVKEKKKKQAKSKITKKKESEEVKMLEKGKSVVELPARVGSGKHLDKKIIDKELKEIYKDQNGEIPDMSKIYHKKRSRTKRVMIRALVFLVFVAAIAAAGFFFLGRQGFSGEEVGLEIISPDVIAGGQVVEYSIKYKNNGSVPLGQAELEVRLPDDFVFSESTPVSSEGRVWQIGSIVDGGSGEIKIKGTLYGAEESFETLQAVLTYKPADFNSEFQKVATAVTKVQGSLLEVGITGPERILANKEATFKIKYKNTGETDLANIKISVVGPEDFSFTEGADGKEVTSWSVDQAAPGEEKEIEFKGAFGPAAEGERELKAQIGFTRGDKFYVQKESVLKTNVLIGAILSTLILNGDSKDRTFNFGDTLNYSIVYQNKDKVDLSDLEVKIVFESTSRNNKMVLDWATLKDDYNGTVLGTQLSPELRQGTITWAKRQISGLARLVPGAEGTINFQIKIKPFSEFANWGIKDFEIKSFASVTIGKGGQAGESETIESNIINFKINSDLGFKTEARYFNDDNIAVGSGPVPPKVGEATAYRIFWTVTNSLHEVENLKVSTILPENIIWSRKYELSAGELKFDEATREVSWTLNRMPLDVKSLGVNFEVTVTPVTADRGKLLTLLLGTNLQATDKSTGGAIAKVADALTSNLDGDPAAEGKGIVK